MSLITDTGIIISNEDMEELQDLFLLDPSNNIPCSNDSKGDRYYREMELFDKYKGTVVERYVKSLNRKLSKVCVIIQEPGDTYPIHADIDDRFHLNLQSDNAYFIDFKTNISIPIETDRKVYLMNTGGLHSAVNFGLKRRLQIGATISLEYHNLKSPMSVNIHYNGKNKNYDYFYNFYVMPWLNLANKNKLINNYVKPKDSNLFVDIEEEQLESLKNAAGDNFEIIML
jgi:hypothetical protein